MLQEPIGSATQRGIEPGRSLRMRNTSVTRRGLFGGGGFGGKVSIYADAVLAALAARQLKPGQGHVDTPAEFQRDDASRLDDPARPIGSVPAWHADGDRA